MVESLTIILGRVVLVKSRRLRVRERFDEVLRLIFQYEVINDVLLEHGVFETIDV